MGENIATLSPKGEMNNTNGLLPFMAPRPSFAARRTQDHGATTGARSHINRYLSGRPYPKSNAIHTICKLIRFSYV